MTTGKTRTVRATAALVVAAWLFARALSLVFPNVFIPWNSQATDLLFQYRSSSDTFRPPYDSIVVHVDLGDRSFERLGTYYPTREHFGEVARGIGMMNVSAQIWDFIFPGRSDDPSMDEIFLRGTEEAGNVYFGAAFRLVSDDTTEGRRIPADREAYLGETSWDVQVEGDRTALFRGINPIITFPELARAARGMGYLSIRIDRDGVFRRAPLLIRYEDAFYPSMPFRAVCDYLGVTPDRIVVRPGESVTLRGAQRPGGEQHDIVIPVNDDVEMTVNFVGDWSRMKHLDFADIYQDAGSSEDLEFLAELTGTEGTIVVVSEVSTGSADVGPIPTDNNYPLSGLHANVLHTILTEDFITEWHGLRVLFLELVLVALLAGIALVSSSRWIWIGALALIMGYLLFVALLFLAGSTIVPVIEPTLTVVIGFMSVSAYRYISEEKAKEVLKRSFEAYFPPSVVRRIMANPDLITVGGQKKELTILFSDIKSFTHQSSTMQADTIQKMLNEYFEAMVDIVFKYEGTVDKFIGDGLMVFFGDPEPQEDHALRCVRAAIEMQKKCRVMKTEWQQKGLFELKIRIGINTGHVVVGNMGSARRLSYTVLGAPVNMAQRLESNAPVEGIMISQRTWELVKDHVRTRPLDPIQPKGIDEPVPVFEVIVDES